MQRHNLAALGIAVGMGIGIGLQLVVPVRVDYALLKARWKDDLMAEVVTAKWLACVKSGGEIDVEHGWVCIETVRARQVPLTMRGHE